MKVSVVIPVYNSESFVDQTSLLVLNELKKYQAYELILVDDGSVDNSANVIARIANENEHVKAISLLKNYGQHSAQLCGISFTTGDVVINMDDDLQNPPEEIHKLVRKISEGYDLVFAKFDNKKHATHRNLGSKVINGINRKLFKVHKDIVLSNFRIFTREVADRILHYNTTFPYIPGMLLMSSNRIGNVVTDHHKRIEGRSNYNWSKLTKLVFRLLFNFSNLPLYFLMVLGIIISLVSIAYGMYLVGKAMVSGVTVPGWTSLMVLISFFSGFIILFLGVIGEYIVRIMHQMLNLKPYQIKTVST